MPTYDYVCDQCGHEFEAFHSMKDDPIQICPECNAKKVRRMIGSGAGIIFKGSGFYETDYKRKSNGSNGSTGKKDSSSTTPGTSSSASEKSSSSETKSKSKSEAVA